MSAAGTGQVWDDASSPGVVRLAQQFETDWQKAPREGRPDPRAYLAQGGMSSSGALLALLRTELALRLSEGDAVRVEAYRARYPELDPDTMVALVYEEYCLREEHGEAVEPRTYYERFPDLEARLRRVLGIHELVGSGRTVSFPMGPSAGPPYPEVGQTTGGFRLVGELGRGSFARVFLAEERLLADRPVALKVSRIESREPQTLARLQHTHIVPVHSYRKDAATGLHLLCMPYLGEVTLARLLADPAWRGAASGGALLEILDRQEPRSPRPAVGTNATGRRELARRPFGRALAWWGARLAEALQHAHERGVLHRDLKPSNVLVTGDGLPMLLDFNLAWETHLDEVERDPQALGGTLAYMAPEHLEALARGEASGVDARSDVYALGVVLYEAAGQRPFEPPVLRDSVQRTLERMAAQRRAGVPPLRDRNPEVSPDFEAVVMRCLAADPEARYGSAAELAADLQAVADDQRLVHASEPWASRAVRWVRRNRARAAVVLPVAMAAAVVMASVADARFKREHLVGQIIGQMQQLIAEGKRLYDTDEVALAEREFRTAYELGGSMLGTERSVWKNDARVQYWQDRARDKMHLARQRNQARVVADDLLGKCDGLWLVLMGFVQPTGDVSAAVRDALKPFYVMEDRSWAKRPEMIHLDAKRQERVIEAVDDLLFLWALYLENQGPTGAREALAVCDRASGLRGGPGPWEALRLQCEARAAGQEPPAILQDSPETDVATARACFRWGLLHAREGRLGSSLTWLDRAARLEPMQFWYHYYLGHQYERVEGQQELALMHYHMAVALNPDSPWARFSRSNLHERLGMWTRAIEDLDVALAHAPPESAVSMRLNRGTLHQLVGRFREARAEYEEVMATARPDSAIHRAARWDLAKLETEVGQPERALAIIDELLASGAEEPEVAFSRAVVLMKLGRAAEAESDLSRLLVARPGQPEYLDLRARALLALGRDGEASRDALMAWELDPTPARMRLRLRALLADGRVENLPLEDPGEWLRLPRAGAGLRSDLERAAVRLRADGSRHPTQRLNLAIVLATMGQRAAASELVDAVVAEDPAAIKPRWIRSFLREQAGDLDGALADVERGLGQEAGDSLLLERKGALLLRTGRAAPALAYLDRALRGGGRASLQRTRAQALLALGQTDAAEEAWDQAIQADPQDPWNYLGRARSRMQIGVQGDYPLADLEKAAAWAGDDPRVMLEVAIEYTRFLGEQTDRLPRAWGLACRSVNLLARDVAGYWDPTGATAAASPVGDKAAGSAH